MYRKSRSLSGTEALQKDHFAESVFMLTFLHQTFGLLNAPADVDIWRRWTNKIITLSNVVWERSVFDGLFTNLVTAEYERYGHWTSDNWIEFIRELLHLQEIRRDNKSRST